MSLLQLILTVRYTVAQVTDTTVVRSSTYLLACFEVGCHQSVIEPCSRDHLTSTRTPHSITSILHVMPSTDKRGIAGPHVRSDAAAKAVGLNPLSNHRLWYDFYSKIALD